MVLTTALRDGKRGVSATGILSNICQLSVRDSRLRQADLGIELEELDVVYTVSLFNSLWQILRLKLVQTLQVHGTLASLLFISQLGFDLLKSRIRLEDIH